MTFFSLQPANSKLQTGTATIKYKMSHVEKLREIFCNKVSKLENEQLHLTVK